MNIPNRLFLLILFLRTLAGSPEGKKSICYQYPLRGFRMFRLKRFYDSRKQKRQQKHKKIFKPALRHYVPG
jgi:hypothetical protein